MGEKEVRDGCNAEEVCMKHWDHNLIALFKRSVLLLFCQTAYNSLITKETHRSRQWPVLQCKREIQNLAQVEKSLGYGSESFRLTLSNATGAD